MSTEDTATEIARRRWNRTARRWDVLMGVIDRLALRKWRKILWSKVENGSILEIGVGTGNNFDYYPADAEITAVDFSGEMLERARDRASRQGVKVHLLQMDVQNLDFADNTFDTVAATLVFCSVPDSVRGIREVERVCKPGGKVILLENDFSSNRILSWVIKLANPFFLRMIGADFKRRPMDNVAKSGLAVERVTEIWASIFNWKLIEARKKAPL